MPTLSINDRTVTVEAGASILDAAKALGIHIPTLCHLEGHPPNASCMLCAVAVAGRSRLLASCAAPAEEGMVVHTDTQDVRDNRRMVLELLLSHHTGDCEAPCTIACPAGLAIPHFLRTLQDGDIEAAAALATQTLVLPRTLGRVCPAPCEKVCRRSRHDGAVAIPALHLSAALWAPVLNLSVRPGYRGQMIAVVGGGPAGLAASWHLLVAGYAVELFEAGSHLGGKLHDAIGPEQAGLALLEADIATVCAAGLVVHHDTPIDGAEALADLRSRFAAVVLAAGSAPVGTAWGLEVAEHGLAVVRGTGQTSAPGIFAAGNAVRDTRRMAVRAVASGHDAAIGVHAWLSSGGEVEPRKMINVSMGTLREGEMARLLETASPAPRCLEPNQRDQVTVEQAIGEAARCLHCDCRAAQNCHLRDYAAEYGAKPSRWRDRRPPFEHDLSHPDIIYEPGKCIACGICVQISQLAAEVYGTTFLGRGIAVRVAPPLQETLANGLAECALACVEACPTGALSRR